MIKRLVGNRILTSLFFFCIIAWFKMYLDYRQLIIALYIIIDNILYRNNSKFFLESAVFSIDRMSE